MNGRPSSQDRTIDVALAEFNALRAEILAHTTSQNAVLGLGFTAIGVLVGLAINSPTRSGMLMLVPVLCGVLIVVYAGLAYRIVVAGNYIRIKLWPYLTLQLPATERRLLPSWEASLAALESKGRHWVFAQVVEFALMVLLAGIGTVSAYFAVDVDESIRWGSAGGLVLVTALSSWLGWRRSLDLEDFNRVQEKSKK